MEKIIQIVKDNKYIAIGAVAVIVLIIILSVSGLFGKKGIVIDGYDSTGIAIDKKGNPVNLELDKDGNVKKAQLTDKAISQLKISKEDAERIVNPYVVNFDENGNVKDLYVFAINSKTHELTKTSVIFNSKYEEDENGNPKLNENGEVIYTSVDENQQNENNTNLEEEDKKDENESDENNGEKIELTEEDLKEVKESSENEISSTKMYIEEVKEEPKSVNKLTDEFYKYNPDSLMIKELPYRDLGLEPKSKSENPFVYYNYNGILGPYRYEGYLNRFIYGVALNYDSLTKFVKFNITKNQTEDISTPPVQLSVSIDKVQMLKEFKKSWMIIKEKNIFEELKNANLDNLTYSSIDKIYPNMLIGSDLSEKYFININYQIEPEDNLGKWKYNKRKEYIKTLNKMNIDTLTDELLLNIYYQCLEKSINEKLEEVKKETCEELNRYGEGTCKDFNQIVPLEIRSDFIQNIYEVAIKNSKKLFVTLVQDIQGEIRYNSLE